MIFRRIGCYGKYCFRKISPGSQSLGTFSAIGSPLAVESLRYTGLDYVIVDTEHSPAGIESAAAQIAAAQAQA